LNCTGKFLLAEKPRVMGILNLTTDSFYEGSRLNTPEPALEKPAQVVAEGADILDTGAQSTRPGSTRMSAGEEIEKAVPIIREIREKHPEIILSIDTYQSEVRVECVHARASLVNDISGGEMDEIMIKTVADLKVPYICMHMK